MIPRRTFFGLPMLAGSVGGAFGARLSAGSLFPITGSNAREEMTIYVRTEGNDSTGDGLAPETAFATPQRAIDALPALISGTVAVDIGPGVYATSSRPASSLDRPAVIYLDRVKSSGRTAQSGDGLSGALVLRLHRDTIIQAGKNGYSYGIYCTGHSGSIAIWGGKVEAAGRCNTLVTAHRGIYLHLRKMRIDGAGGASIGLVAEGGGFLECVEVDAYGSHVDLQTYAGSFAQMAAPKSSHQVDRVAIGPGSMASLYMAMRITYSLINRGVCELNGGPDGQRVHLEGSYDGRNSKLHAVRTDFRSKDANGVTARCDSWETGDFAFDCVLNLFGGNYNLAGSRSFVSSGRSPHARPIRAAPGTFVYRDATINWTSSAGRKVGVFFLPLTVSVSSDNFIIPPAFNSAASVLIQLTNDTGALRHGCTVGGVAAMANGHPPDTGSELTLIHAGGAGIEIVQRAEARQGRPARRIVLGAEPGMVMSARFVWLDDGEDAGKWMCLC